MQVITADFVKNKKVLLRLDLDVSIENGKVTEDFRLKAALPTINLCLQNASQVIIMGHIGRPTFAEATAGKPSVAPIWDWLIEQDLTENGKLKLLENLRFDPREDTGDLNYARELAEMGDIYINEAFSSYRPAVSTTVLPTLLPHGAGLHFAQEVRKLGEVRDNPKKPFIAIMGGAKVKDKLPVIKVLAKQADAVLVGGKLVAEIREQNITLPKNVMVGKLTEDGFDIAPETTESWKNLIRQSRMIVWNGPLGKFEDPKNDQSAKIARLVLDSGAETIVGGGDTISLLNQLDLLDQFDFVSVGGGAMLKFLAEGTLPTIQALT